MPFRYRAWAAIAATTAAAVTHLYAQPQGPPQFRTGTALVPVDVRVLDRNGKPVTDLTAADFTITDDGVPQRVAQFVKETYSPDTSLVSIRRPRRTSDGLEPTAANQRVFLIVLGQGRIQQPFKSIDALIAFVKSLSPQDLVGISAYNRFADLAPADQGNVKLLERYRDLNEEIESHLESFFAPHVLKINDIPDSVQQEIDKIFVSQEGRAVRDVPIPHHVGYAVSPQSFQRTDELFRTFAAIEYLRGFEGEKHIILLTQQGSGFGSGSLGMFAADARVAIHIIQTAGVDVSLPKGGGLPYVSQFVIWNHQIADEIATETGGFASWHEDPTEAFDEIGAALQLEYILGYEPEWRDDGKLHHVLVTVDRPGVSVLYRHGYYARHVVQAAEDATVLENIRIADAKGTSALSHEIQVKAVARRERAEEGRRVDVDARIVPAGIYFATENALHVADFDVEISATDDRGASVGDHRETVHLKLKDDTFQALLRKDIEVQSTLETSRRADRVKVIVYDAAWDRLGSAAAFVR